MSDPSANDAFEKVARLCGVVEIIGERVHYRFGHNYLRSEMRDGVDAILCDNRVDEGHVAKVADEELRRRWHGPGETRGKVVEHDYGLASIEQRMNHMPANVAGTAGNHNCHGFAPWCLLFLST